MGATQARESRYLNKEYSERLAAQRSYSMGNFRGGQVHDSFANQYAYKADSTHARRYQRGKTALPFAPHPMGAPLAAPLAAPLMAGPPLMAPTVLEMPVGEIVTREIIPTTVMGTYMSPAVETIEYDQPVIEEEEYMTFVGQPTVCTFEHLEPAGGLGFTTLGSTTLASTYW